MGWQWGSIPVNMYAIGAPPIIASYLLLTDNTPLLLTDNTGMLLAGT